MGPPGRMPQVIVCALLCVFTNNIHVSVKIQVPKAFVHFK